MVKMSDFSSHTIDLRVEENLKVKSMEEAANTLSKSFNDNSPHPKMSWVMQQIQTLLESNEDPQSSFDIIFQNTPKAAKFNSKLIQNYDYDFNKTCKKQKGSVISPGTEF